MSSNARSNFLKDKVVNFPMTHLQYGALPYRDNRKIGLEILLITSRETTRWIIPKGWPINGLQPNESAAREAYEEAGARGTIGSKPIGSYVYNKLEDTQARYEVIVFPLHVRRQEKVWPESQQRKIRWFLPATAIASVDDDQLKILITAFAESWPG